MSLFPKITDSAKQPVLSKEQQEQLDRVESVVHEILNACKVGGLTAGETATALDIAKNELNKKVATKKLSDFD